LGAAVFVVHPEKPDLRHKGVITGKTDAREPALKRDHCVNGNTLALCVLRTRCRR